MKEEKILQEVATYVERKLSGEGSGHDWWHIVRVRKLAEKLALAEGRLLYLSVGRPGP